jgi:hypothetical protein
MWGTIRTDAILGGVTGAYGAADDAADNIVNLDTYIFQ